jgi:hypothetical protein
MKRNLTLLTLVVGLSILAYNNCSAPLSATNASSSVGGQRLSTATPLPITGTESYVLPITIGTGNVDTPMVSVQVCNGTKCVTVNNVLVDTGSYGLRVYSSAISGLGLTQMSDASGNALAECVTYGDGSSDWGPLTQANVVMGGETAQNVPIQVINSAWGGAPSDCTNLDTGPSDTSWNGILGVGLFAQDCGEDCAQEANNRWYFNCAPNVGSCDDRSVAVDLAYQVTNPVAMLPIDNQGVAMQIPLISSSGATAVGGYLVLGIGSQSHNSPPSGTVTLGADANANFQTQYNGQTYSTAIIDSGSNALYFPTNLAVCTGNNAGWLCPPSTQTLSATQLDANGDTSVPITFQIANTTTLLNSGYQVFDDLGAPETDSFDWGLPFFFGRTVYVGIQGRSSPLGTGPYWAY